MAASGSSSDIQAVSSSNVPKVELKEVYESYELSEIIIVKAVAQVAEQDIAKAIPFLMQILMAFPATYRTNICNSDSLWNNLNEKLWESTGGRKDFERNYKVYKNFYVSKSVYLEIDSPQMCRSIGLLEDHMVCGFIDGTIRVFVFVISDSKEIQPYELVREYAPYTANRKEFGPFSRSVIGMILKMIPTLEVTFGCIDGNIYKTDVSRKDLDVMYEGNSIIDGTMLDFTGNQLGWVAIYAGVEGRSFRVWGINREIIYIGGAFTDFDADLGMQMMSMENMDEMQAVARVQMVGNIIIGCTKRAIISFAVENPQLILNHEILEGDIIIVEAFSSNSHSFVVATTDFHATVRRIQSFEVTHRITTFQPGGTAYFGVLKKHFLILYFEGNGRIYTYNSQREQIFDDPLLDGNRRLSRKIETIKGRVMALATDYKYLVATTPRVLHVWVHLHPHLL